MIARIRKMGILVEVLIVLCATAAFGVDNNTYPWPQNGSVGIGTGTTGLASVFEVVGDLTTRGAASGYRFGDRTYLDHRWIWYATSDVARLNYTGGGDKLLVKSTGEVGVGTSPWTNAALHVKLLNGGGQVYFANGTPNDNQVWMATANTAGDGSPSALHITGYGGNAVPLLELGATAVYATGRLGIGTSSPCAPLHVKLPDGGGQLYVASNSNDNQVYIESANSAGDGSPAILHITGYGGNPVPTLAIAADSVQTTGELTTGGNIYAGGQASACQIVIRGGCDLAEPFAVVKSKGEDERIEPGMVVVIDPDHAGQLKLATEGYDHKVAGIISGANGLPAGMIMSAENNPAIRPADDTENSEPRTETSSHPVALTGRVWCWCDASYGAITPGDRLTTSDTPGHAMKVTDRDHADGAVVGKAMSELRSGKGLVLVLVSMQ
jgi:hypothetical protein